MVDVRAFHALRPLAQLAADIAAPPYDVVDVAQARLLAKDNPLSFLHVTRPEIDLPDDVDPHSAQVYQRGADALRQLIEADSLVVDPAPTMSIYRQQLGDHIQTGVVCCTAVADYDSGAVRTHEQTRPDKEADRVRHIEALAAHDEPVFLLAPPSEIIDDMLGQVCATRPELDFTAGGGVRHTLWPVTDRETIDRLVAAYRAMPRLYVADGHHRSAAASRVWAARRARGDTGGDAFLTVVFGADQLRILPYNRVLTDLGDTTVAELLRALDRHFVIEPSATPVTPSERHVFGFYAQGSWSRLTARAGTVDESDDVPGLDVSGLDVSGLDVSILQDKVLTPLGITDPRADPRITFVGGIRGHAELERIVDAASGAASEPAQGESRTAVAFSLHPTSIAELLAVADRGEMMPPKSTWFEPKLLSGLFVHPFAQ